MTPTYGASAPETSPFEAAPADNDQELARLVRSIQFVENFTVLIAVCNSNSLRKTLIKRMKSELPDRQFIELAMFEPVENLYRDLQTRLEEPGAGPPPIVMVYGIEAWLPSEGATSPFVANLNVTRNHFEKIINGPLVLWLPAHGLEAIALGAPDFFSVRSTVATFASSPADRNDMDGTLLSLELSGVAGLSIDEKNARESRLFRMLAEFNELPKEKRDPAIEKRLLSSVAEILFTQARYVEAESLYRRALEIGESAQGPDSPEVAVDLNNLAGLLQVTNRPLEAEPLYRRALTSLEQTLGGTHPQVAAELNNLAQLLQSTNRLAEAEPLMLRALAINEQAIGPDHPDVATALNNLAGLFYGTNRLAEAEPLMRRALAINEQSFGADHPKVATTLNNLGELLRATNRLAEAEPLIRRALAIDEQSFGPDHPEVAGDLGNLALLLQLTDRMDEAEPLVRRALAIDEQAFGSDHPRVAVDLNNLAGIFQATDRYVEAEPLFRRALAIDEHSYGAEHPRVAVDLNNLAQLLKATKRVSEAEPLMRRHVEIFLEFARKTGYPHPHLQSALGNYEGLLQQMGKSNIYIQDAQAVLLAQFDVPHRIKTGAIDAEADQDTITAFLTKGLGADSEAAEPSD